MNKEDEFVLTELWSKKLKDNLRSFYRTVYFGPPIFILLNVFFCFALQRGTNIDFWVLYIPIIILSTIYCVLIPRKAIKRYSNVTESFEFKSTNELRVTLIGGRTLIIEKPEFKDGFFKVGNAEKKCKTLISNSDKCNYTIIPEFFTQVPIL